jgi:hypothetical protein
MNTTAWLPYRFLHDFLEVCATQFCGRTLGAKSLPVKTPPTPIRPTKSLQDVERIKNVTDQLKAVSLDACSCCLLKLLEVCGKSIEIYRDRFELNNSIFISYGFLLRDRVPEPNAWRHTKADMKEGVQEDLHRSCMAQTGVCLCTHLGAVSSWTENSEMADVKQCSVLTNTRARINKADNIQSGYKLSENFVTS